MAFTEVRMIENIQDTSRNGWSICISKFQRNVLLFRTISGLFAYHLSVTRTVLNGKLSQTQLCLFAAFVFYYFYISWIVIWHQHKLMLFLCSLIHGKYPHIFRCLLSLIFKLNTIEIWMESVFPLFLLVLGWGFFCFFGNVSRIAWIHFVLFIYLCIYFIFVFFPNIYSNLFLRCLLKGAW